MSRGTSKPKLREARTLVVTEVLVSPEEQGELASLYKDSRYQNALLNVMERACISLDTAHINTPLGNRDEILLTFAVAKASWLFFTYVQKHVLNAYNNQSLEPDEKQAPDLSEVIQSLRGMEFNAQDEGEGEGDG